MCWVIHKLVFQGQYELKTTTMTRYPDETPHMAVGLSDRTFHSFLAQDYLNGVFTSPFEKRVKREAIVFPLRLTSVCSSQP